jgi:hypothetical protein
MALAPDQFDIDTAGWTQVGGTGAGAYYRAEDGILVAVPKRGFEQSAAAALASLDELDRLAHEAGGRQAVIVIVDRVASQARGSGDGTRFVTFAWHRSRARRNHRVRCCGRWGRLLSDPTTVFR